MNFRTIWQKVVPIKWVSVSGLVDRNFRSYNSRKGSSADRKKQAAAAKQAADSALFLREQLFKCIYNEPYSTVFKAENEDETTGVDFTTEIGYFKKFIADTQILKSAIIKVDFPVISKQHKVRGKVALICGGSGGSGYGIYGFSVSGNIGHVINGKFVPTNSNPIGAKGLNSLSEIEDTKYWREVIKINLYRLILSREYDLNIDTMTLVVLNKIYGKYHAIDIPIMEQQTTDIIARSH